MICNASGKNLPVIKGFQAGHIIPNYPIILGHEIKISRKGKSVFLEQSQ
jgi:muramoyltetrapeptide carboxypeptidase LdcA involved in peptidoglycan recycling